MLTTAVARRYRHAADPGSKRDGRGLEAAKPSLAHQMSPQSTEQTYAVYVSLTGSHSCVIYMKLQRVSTKVVNARRFKRSLATAAMSRW